MKKVRFYGMALLMILLTAGFVSCSKSSDDDKEDTASYATNIVGVWTISVDEGWEIDDDGQKDTWKDEKAEEHLKFYKDGTGTHADDQNFNPFSWKIVGSTLSITPTTSSYDSEIWTIKSLNAKTMILEKSETKSYDKYTCTKN